MHLQRHLQCLSSSEFLGLDVHLSCSQCLDGLIPMQTPTPNPQPFTVTTGASSSNFHRTQKKKASGEIQAVARSK